MKTPKLALLAALLTLAPALFAADFGIRTGRYADSDEDFVGAEVVFDLGAVHLNPNVEYQLSENDGTAGTVNLDMILEVSPRSRVNPFIGAGVGLMYIDDDLGDNQTDLVGNLIGGLALPMDFLTPYAQVKYYRMLESDDGGDAGDDIAFTIGIRF